MANRQSCVSDALLKIQNHHRNDIGCYDENKQKLKRKIIKVTTGNGWALLNQKKRNLKLIIVLALTIFYGIWFIIYIL